MICKKPYRQGVAEYGCGQCMPCRINRRNLWTARVLLEAQTHVHSWFVTLTYSEENIPADESVSPREVQLFMKRLRALVPERIRYYAVGEYGDQSGRPHYHLAIFGLPDPRHVNPRDVHLYALPPCACVLCKAWNLGGIDVREVAQETASYLVGYVTAKHTRSGDPWLRGRHPEFARMSLKPGIGAPACEVLAENLTTHGGAKALLATGDVPNVVRWEKRMRPLGRYLRRRIRQELGMDSRMPDPAREALSLRRQVEMSVPGAREKRESKRQAVAARAENLNRINQTKGVKL